MGGVLIFGGCAPPRGKGGEGGNNLRGEIGRWVGPDEGALARGVLSEFDGHFLGGSGSVPSMMRHLDQPPRFFFLKS